MLYQSRHMDLGDTFVCLWRLRILGGSKANSRGVIKEFRGYAIVGESNDVITYWLPDLYREFLGYRYVLACDWR
jgi:hypothetical protein